MVAPADQEDEDDRERRRKADAYDDLRDTVRALLDTLPVCDHIDCSGLDTPPAYVLADGLYSCGQHGDEGQRDEYRAADPRRRVLAALDAPAPEPPMSDNDYRSGRGAFKVVKCAIDPTAPEPVAATVSCPCCGEPCACVTRTAEAMRERGARRFDHRATEMRARLQSADRLPPSEERDRLVSDLWGAVMRAEADAAAISALPPVAEVAPRPEGTLVECGTPTYHEAKLNRMGYQQLIDGDIAWLRAQPRTLERDHVIMIVEASPGYEYPDAPTPPTTQSRVGRWSEDGEHWHCHCGAGNTVDLCPKDRLHCVYCSTSRPPLPEVPHG